MTFSRGGGRGTARVYGSDTICVMTSAPTRPFSSVNKQLGRAWMGMECRLQRWLGPARGRGLQESGLGFPAPQEARVPEL